MVEGNFIHAPELGAGVGGFQATFFVSSENAASAVGRVRWKLLDRMKVHGVVTIERGFCRSYFIIRDAWEVSEERFLRAEGDDLGFIFFNIRLIDCAYAASRRVLIEKFRSHILVFPADQDGRFKI